MPNHSDRPEFQQAIKDGNGSSHRMSETLNKITYYYAEKTADGSVIRVAKTIDSIYGIFLFVIPSILIIMIGVFVVCTILAKRSTKKIVEPIKEIKGRTTATARRMMSFCRSHRKLQASKDKSSVRCADCNLKRIKFQRLSKIWRRALFLLMLIKRCL